MSLSIPPRSALNYVVEGEGSAVLLLHPVGLDLRMWEPYARLLRRDHRVARVDFRGHGRSPLGDASFGLPDLADDVAGLSSELSLGPAHVVGVSMGSMTAQYLAIRHPHLVRSLVLASTAGDLSARARAASRARAQAARTGGMGAVLEETVQRWFLPHERESAPAREIENTLCKLDPGAWAHGWDAISQLSTVADLPSIQVPTLVMTGDQDVATPSAAGRQVAASIPGARFVDVENGSHMMAFIRVDRVLGLVGGFIASVENNADAVPYDDHTVD